MEALKQHRICGEISELTTEVSHIDDEIEEMTNVLEGIYEQLQILNRNMVNLFDIPKK